MFECVREPLRAFTFTHFDLPRVSAQLDGSCGLALFTGKDMWVNSVALCHPDVDVLIATDRRELSMHTSQSVTEQFIARAPGWRTSFNMPTTMHRGRRPPKNGDPIKSRRRCVHRFPWNLRHFLKTLRKPRGGSPCPNQLCRFTYPGSCTDFPLVARRPATTSGSGLHTCSSPRVRLDQL